MIRKQVRMSRENILSSNFIANGKDDQIMRNGKTSCFIKHYLYCLCVKEVSMPSYGHGGMGSSPGQGSHPAVPPFLGRSINVNLW